MLGNRAAWRTGLVAVDHERVYGHAHASQRVAGQVRLHAARDEAADAVRLLNGQDAGDRVVHSRGGCRAPEFVHAADLEPIQAVLAWQVADADRCGASGTRGDAAAECRRH